MLTRTQLRDDLLAKLGQEVPASATTVEQAEVVRSVNAALQLLWLGASAFFLRQSIPVTLVAGQADYVLSATAQVASGPVRCADGRTLRRFDNRAQLDDYALEMLGATERTVANGVPWGFLIEHTRNTGSGDDPHVMTLRLQPAPDAAAVTALSAVTVDGVLECPSYAYGDLASGVVPVADGYAETFLLPLARRELTRSHLFSRTELRAVFEADAQRADLALGLVQQASEDTGDTGQAGKAAKHSRKDQKQ